MGKKKWRTFSAEHMQFCTELGLCGRVKLERKLSQETQVTDDQDTERREERQREEVFLWLMQSRSLMLGAPVPSRQC